MNLTEEQSRELKMLKLHYPYRIIYGVLTEGGIFTCSAVTNMRIPNRLTKEGHKVFIVK